MSDQDIYGKTAAGFDEVRARGLKLPQRLRTMLIMVDGTRSVPQLREAAQTLGAPADFLETLLGMGLIAAERVVLRDPVPAPPPPPPPPTMPAPAPAPNPAPVSTAPAAASPGPGPATPAETAAEPPSEAARFRATLKFLNDSAVDLLGLRAFFFTLKLEKCFTAQDLLAILPDFTKAIAKSNGPEMARALEERARQLLRG